MRSSAVSSTLGAVRGKYICVFFYFFFSPLVQRSIVTPNRIIVFFIFYFLLSFLFRRPICRSHTCRVPPTLARRRRRFTMAVRIEFRARKYSARYCCACRSRERVAISAGAKCVIVAQPTIGTAKTIQGAVVVRDELGDSGLKTKSAGTSGRRNCYSSQGVNCP